MLRCPTCHEQAEHAVYRNDSFELPAGPAIRICHSSDGAYVHVVGDDDE